MSTNPTSGSTTGSMWSMTTFEFLTERFHLLQTLHRCSVASILWRDPSLLKRGTFLRFSRIISITTGDLEKARRSACRAAIIGSYLSTWRCHFSAGVRTFLAIPYILAVRRRFMFLIRLIGYPNDTACYKRLLQSYAATDFECVLNCNF